jgi:hypothetical protein
MGVQPDYRLLSAGPGGEEDDDSDTDEAPETPTDEPRPQPVQDPPSQPDKGPYVVYAGG